MQTHQMDLKGSNCPKSSLLRNDYICYQGSISKCINKSLLSFQDIDTKATTTIDQPDYWRLDILQLVPMKWDVNEGEVVLTGRQLGLGPQHTCRVIGLKEFEELNVINREASRGNKTEYFVEMAVTKDAMHYLLNIEIR